MSNGTEPLRKDGTTANTASRPPGHTQAPSGRTQSSADTEAQPRMPHEHDESSDSQNGKVRPVIKQAHDDVTSGKVDTDRGKPMDEAYKKQKTGG